MLKINSRALPVGALLEHYRNAGDYTDCYSTEISAPISHEQLVRAFYTTRLFKIERFILKWVVGRPSSDIQAFKLAEGTNDKFAAWFVERRIENQLLLSDYREITRSWLMVAPYESGAGIATRLYFGSAVVANKGEILGKKKFNFVFRSLLGFHKAYSIGLLYAARSKLEKEVK